MDENDSVNVDIEFKRYLQIIRPYLGHLGDQYAVELSNAWIQRLSNCSENEKSLRNKYIFALCYQLARGELEEPFLKCPINGNLLPLSDELYSDDSSSEVEYININGDKDNTKVLFNNRKSLVSDTEFFIQENEVDDCDKNRNVKNVVNEKTSTHTRSEIPTRKQAVLCYTLPETFKKNSTDEYHEEYYEFRTHNLIKKLRDLKTQNILLHNELVALKEESKTISYLDESVDGIIRVDNATSTYFHINESNSTIKSLMSKLQELKDSRNNLIKTVENLQEKLDNYDEMKKHEIEDIETNNKLEIIAAKSAIKEEITLKYKNKFDEQKLIYETKIKEVENKIDFEKSNFITMKENILTEKDEIIKTKDAEINQLQTLVEDQKTQLQAILSKCLENSKDDGTTENLKIKAEQLEKRLLKVEKSKTKCIRIYETKLAQLQREKHIIECSLQFQLFRQKAQIINEISDENQADLVTALDKLETKYKDIVANVQATSIQRRLQDQVVLHSLIQKECGVQNENTCGNCPRDTNHSQSSGRTMHNQGRNENHSYDSEISTITRGHRVGNVIVGNKSFGEDSVMAGYCLDGERMGQLFERVYIPQRDIGDGSLK
ncbi:uncharacterized protein ACR2FA_007350 [Aphomia sociella]